jgi:hypothetical protein
MDVPPDDGPRYTQQQSSKKNMPIIVYIWVYLLMMGLAQNM